MIIQKPYKMGIGVGDTVTPLLISNAVWTVITSVGRIVYADGETV